jgi:hypothetical protein
VGDLIQSTNMVSVEEWLIYLPELAHPGPFSI